MYHSLTSSTDKPPAAKRPKKDIDIFASLLSDTQPDDSSQGDLPCADSLDGANCSTTLTSISPDGPLSTALHKSLFIILKKQKSGSITLTMRKVRTVSGEHSSCPFSIDPAVIMEVTCDEWIGSSLPACIPTIIAQSDSSSISSSSTCQLPPGFFSAIFGRGVSLSNSSALFYASPISGTLHACDLKCPAGYFSEFCGQVQNNSYRVLYSIEQPVVNIHPFKSRPDSGIDSLLFVGAKGKFVLCSSASNDRHGLDFQDFFLRGPILSSLFVDDFGLLFSTADKISLICLKPQCLSTPNTQASLSLLEAFYSPIVILNSPLYLLSSSQPNDDHNLSVLGLSVCGQLVEFFVSTSLDGSSRETASAAQVGEKMALTCRSIEESSAQLEHVQGELSKIDGLIGQFGQDLSLLCSVVSQPSPCPFLCEVSGCSEQISLSESRSSVVVNLTYAGSTPLSSNWTLLIQTTPTNSRHSLTQSSTPPTTLSSSLSLTGLTPRHPITVKQLCPPSLHTPLSVRCLLHYRPSLPEALSNNNCTNGVAVPIKSLTLTSLDFLRPQSAATTITIGEGFRHTHSTPISTPTGYLHISNIIINSHYTQSLFIQEGNFDAIKLMHSVLFPNVYPQANSLVSCITSSSLNDCSELKAISSDGTPVLFRMQALSRANGPQAELTIRTTSQLLMVQLCEAIHQNVQVRVRTCICLCAM